MQADVEEELEPLIDLLEHAFGDLGLPSIQLELAEEDRTLPDGVRRDRSDRATADRDREGDRLEPGA